RVIHRSNASLTCSSGRHVPREFPTWLSTNDHRLPGAGSAMVIATARDDGLAVVIHGATSRSSPQGQELVPPYRGTGPLRGSGWAPWNPRWPLREETMGVERSGGAATGRLRRGDRRARPGDLV